MQSPDEGRLQNRNPEWPIHAHDFPVYSLSAHFLNSNYSRLSEAELAHRQYQLLRITYTVHSTQLLYLE